MNEEDGGDERNVALVEVNIRDIIRNRKAERRTEAEEKRQADLQRIREMRSPVGIDPLQQFPKEIWLQICDELDPEDGGNIWQVHPLFRDLMENTRVRDILFPQVLRIILSQYRKLLWPNLHQGHFQEQLRHVSKSAKRSFDQWMEDSLIKRVREKHAIFFVYDLDIANIEFDSGSGTVVDWEKLKSLLVNFKGEENCGKRFFPRGLGVSFDDYEEANAELKSQFQNDITALLKLVGHQIWHFRFLLEEFSSFSFADLYILLQGWASLMPNLMWLELLICPSILEISDEVSKKAAESTLLKFPFPRLTHLERLGLHSTRPRRIRTDGFHNIYKIILEANQHIKTLDFRDWDDGSSHLSPQLVQSLQLTSFIQWDQSIWNYDRPNIGLARIRSIVNPDWKLGTIVLQLSKVDVSSDSVTCVLRYLNKFPTLKKVKLMGLDNFIVRDTHKIGYLELYNLTDFGLEATTPEIDYDSNIDFFFSLQFLVKCEKLKEIYWQLRGFNYAKLREHLKMNEVGRCKEMIDFRGGLRYLYDSNIWQVLPDLKSVYVSFQRVSTSNGHYCSHEYERRDFGSGSIRQFWKSHVCILENHGRDCVM